MTAYYNEHDKEKAAWIRELIKAQVVADGEVDERGIEDVQAADLAGFTQCHFFAGIAVWSYALRLAGWPDDRPAWTGSCPCPSFSCAGKGEGFDDPRHLWPEFYRLIRERKPATIFGEQSADAIRHGWWDLVSTDLESQAYAAASAVLTSAGVGGPDIRHRLYFVGLADTVHSKRWQDAEGWSNDQHGDNAGRHEASGRCGVDSEAVRMADAAARGRGVLRSASRSPGHIESSYEISRLDDAERTRLEGQSGDGDDGNESGWFGAQPTRPISRLADPDGGESGFGDVQRSGKHGLLAQDGSLRVEHFAADALNGFWRTADWLFCTDGRWRPVEAGTFPLADGAAFRLGRLRGYGDAINAEAAKAFIEAYLETERILESVQ